MRSKLARLICPKAKEPLFLALQQNKIRHAGSISVSVSVRASGLKLASSSAQW
jgi:hypothetical protein